VKWWFTDSPSDFFGSAIFRPKWRPKPTIWGWVLPTIYGNSGMVCWFHCSVWPSHYPNEVFFKGSESFEADSFSVWSAPFFAPLFGIREAHNTLILGYLWALPRWSWVLGNALKPALTTTCWPREVPVTQAKASTAILVEWNRLEKKTVGAVKHDETW